MSFSQPWWGGGKIWENLPGTCCPERDEILNGAFRDGSKFWTVGANWSVLGNTMKHTPGSTAVLKQLGTLLTNGQGSIYEVRCTIGGTAGTVAVKFGLNTVQTISAGYGDYKNWHAWSAADPTLKISFVPSSDFDGTISNVSVKGIAQECD